MRISPCVLWLLAALLVVFPYGGRAQTLGRGRVSNDSLMQRMLFYRSLVERIAAPPDSSSEVVRLVKLHQQNDGRQCDYTLYVFQLSRSPRYLVKKFVLWEDTVVNEAPLMELSQPRSTEMDRLFRKASRFVLQPYSVHFTSLNGTPYEEKKKDAEQKDYWSVEFCQYPPYRPLLNKWHQENSLNIDPVNKGLVLAWRKRKAVRGLRRIVREFTSCS